MSQWALPFLLLWCLGSGAGTALAILLMKGGSTKAAPFVDDLAAHPEQREAA